MNTILSLTKHYLVPNVDTTYTILLPILEFFLLNILSKNKFENISERERITDVPVIEIDDFVEEECTSRSTREACTYQLSSVGEVGVARSTGEQAGAADVLEKYHSHVNGRQKNPVNLKM